MPVYIQGQQCALASTMLSAAKGELMYLGDILEAAQQHIQSPSHLFKLAQDAFRYAIPSSSNHQQTSSLTHKALLNVSFQLGLQVMKNTKSSSVWRRRDMVRWLVTCATEIGREGVTSLLQSWK